jgi:hypothetical protein
MITYRDGMLSVSGDVYRVDGTPDGRFYSYLSSYKNPRLYYMYSRTSVAVP